MGGSDYKALQYIQALDDARCEGNWDAVGELVRKIRKHAPDRNCLALTAETECVIATKTAAHALAATGLGSGNRPSTAASSAKELDVARVLPRLLTAIEEETRYAEDRFQAMVCVGWLHWAVGEYNLAAVRLPKVGEHEWRSVALPPAAAEEGGGAGAEAGAATGGRPKSSRSTKAGTTTVITANEPSEWTRVCALKAAYLRANCLERCNELQPQSQQQQQQQQQQTVAEGSGAAADAAALSPLPKSGGGVAALAVFEAALPSLFPPTIATPQAAAAARSQLRYWSELFLMEFCMLQGRALRSGDRSLRDPNSLACFRAWARYWETTAATSSVTSSFSAASSTTSTGTTLPAGLAGGFGFRGAVPRRRVWYEYYQAVSGVVAADLPFPPTGAPAVQNHDQQVVSARSQLRAELKRVEAAYETLLLAETTFPRADEDRDEVETFVDLVVQNWTVLAGRGWREQDLGSGGREGLARSVLDMLYRASTRTFHSTAILRHLFTLHVAVAEFDLAFKAFDAYRDIVLKGRARVEKTGHAEPNLDSDATILETMALAVTVCCRYGPREAVEKARGIADELEQWIGRAPQGPVSSQPTSPGETLATMTATTPGTAGQPPQHLHAPGNGVVTINGYHGGGANGAISFSDIPPAVQSTVWQAVGMAHATWSRVTFDASARTDIQAKAIQCLRRSLAPELGRSRDVRALFALALLLAERRELGVAIDVVKSALMAHKADPDEGGPSGAVDANVSPPDVLAGPYWQERLLVPLWHLLALLLSAKQEYLLAARACEGAFEQFKDPAVLFGSADLSIRPQQPRQQFRSDHLNEAERQKHGGAAAADERPRGLVDEMDDFEKEGILEIKMTQLALVELMEGPDVAVNASYELLSLFARLFGPVDGSQPAPVQQKLASAVPKSSAGTLRSIKGSIFGRSDRPGNRLSRQASSTSTAVGADRSAVSAASRPQTQQRGPPTTESSTVTQAPTIHVTQERTTTATTTDGGRRSRRASVSRPPPSASTLSHRRSESAKRASLQKRDSSGAMPGRRTVSSSGIPRHAPTAAEGESYVTSGTDEPRRQNGFYKSSGGGGSANTGNNVNRQSSSNLNRQPSTLSATGTTKGTNSMPHMDSHMSSKFTGGTVDLSEQLSAAVAAGARRGPKRLTISTLPVTQFPRDQEKKRRTVILVKVWLMIAGFYRRASMYDDCKGAISEAQKLVKSLEADVTRDAPGTASLRNAGWACRKSVDELSGDVYAELGYLSLARESPYIARSEFELALMHFPDHPSATIGLSNILLDIYNETLLPPPAIPGLNVATSGSVTGSLLAAHGSTLSTTESLSARRAGEPYLSGSDSALPSGPLGLGFGGPPSSQQQQQQQNQHHARRQPLAAHSRGATSLGGGPSHASTVLPSTPFSSSILAELQRESNPADSGGPGSASSGDETHVLPPPYKARSLPLVDRIAARDRAFTLLSGLTRLGSGWNSADAWFALARAHEECGQNDRARDLLWWCVELEEGTGVRDWSCVGGGVGYVL